MSLVAGLDFGGGAVKAAIVDASDGTVVSSVSRATTTWHPAPGRAEFDPEAWWTVAATAMREAVAAAERDPDEYSAVTVTSLRQGYVLLDDDSELGPGVLNSDRRGEPMLDRLRTEIGVEQLYRTTGHWPAPQLTLPKLLAEQVEDRDRWAQTKTMLFVHDWALWRLSGVRVSEPTMASAGQLLDIRLREWATGLMETLGLESAVLPELRDAGTAIGELRDHALGLPLGLPIVVGGGDTQLAAAGVGGLADGVVTVVAGTTTPLQASSAIAPDDPLRHPWVSAHLVPGRWAVETNAGYTGMSFDWLAGLAEQDVATLADEAATSEPGARGVTALVAAREWSESTWSTRTPSALIGFEPRHTRADIARAFIEAHAYAIRGNLEDLERVLGAPAREVRLAGGATRSATFCQLVADVTGRAVHVHEGADPTARGFAWLAGQASDRGSGATASGVSIESRPDDAYEEGYARFVAAGDTVRDEFSGWTA